MQRPNRGPGVGGDKLVGHCWVSAVNIEGAPKSSQDIPVHTGRRRGTRTRRKWRARTQAPAITARTTGSRRRIVRHVPSGADERCASRRPRGATRSATSARQRAATRTRRRWNRPHRRRARRTLSEGSTRHRQLGSPLSGRSSRSQHTYENGEQQGEPLRRVDTTAERQRDRPGSLAESRPPAQQCHTTARDVGGAADGAAGDTADQRALRPHVTGGRTGPDWPQRTRQTPGRRSASGSACRGTRRIGSARTCSGRTCNSSARPRISSAPGRDRDDTRAHRPAAAPSRAAPRRSATAPQFNARMLTDALEQANNPTATADVPDVPFEAESGWEPAAKRHCRQGGVESGERLLAERPSMTFRGSSYLRPRQEHHVLDVRRGGPLEQAVPAEAVPALRPARVPELQLPRAHAARLPVARRDARAPRGVDRADRRGAAPRIRHDAPREHGRAARRRPLPARANGTEPGPAQRRHEARARALRPGLHDGRVPLWARGRAMAATARR